MYVKIKLIFSKGSMVAVRVFLEFRLFRLKMMLRKNLSISLDGLISVR